MREKFSNTVILLFALSNSTIMCPIDALSNSTIMFIFYGSNHSFSMVHK
jgi:hypothetical protein